MSSPAPSPSSKRGRNTRFLLAVPAALLLALLLAVSVSLFHPIVFWLGEYRVSFGLLTVPPGWEGPAVRNQGFNFVRAGTLRVWSARLGNRAYLVQIHG